MASGTQADRKSANCSKVTVRAAPFTGCLASMGTRF